jgi:hypothetical protein
MAQEYEYARTWRSLSRKGEQSSIEQHPETCVLHSQAALRPETLSSVSSFAISRLLTNSYGEYLKDVAYLRSRCHRLCSQSDVSVSSTACSRHLTLNQLLGLVARRLIRFVTGDFPSRSALLSSLPRRRGSQGRQGRGRYCCALGFISLLGRAGLGTCWNP